MPKLRRVPSCHPTERYYAKDLCKTCFLTAYPRPKKSLGNKGATACHPTRPGYAKRLCKECYYKQYIEPKREEQRQRSRKYYQENKARVIEAIKTYRTKNKGKVWKRTYKQKMLQRIRSRAKSRGLIFKLTCQDFTVPDLCPVLGIPLVPQEGKPADCSPSLDRIDNNLGYIKGNVIVISNRANTLKSDGTIEEHRRIADFYARFDN